MAEVRWSITAADDLQQIEDFISRDSALYAIRMIDRIVEAVDASDLPFLRANGS